VALSHHPVARLPAALLVVTGALSGGFASADTPPSSPGAQASASPAPSVSASPAPSVEVERRAEAAPQKKERPAWYGPAMIAGGAAWFASSYIPYYVSVDSSGKKDGLLFVPIVGNVVQGVDGVSAVAEGRASLRDGLDTAIAIWAGVGQVVGLVFLTAGVVLTVESARAPAKAVPGKAAWSLSPAAGPGWGSLVLTGAF